MKWRRSTNYRTNVVFMFLWLTPCLLQVPYGEALRSSLYRRADPFAALRAANVAFSNEWLGLVAIALVLGPIAAILVTWINRRERR